MKKNCWEIKKCGKERNLFSSDKSVVCPAAISSEHNGDNGGINGGRICWRVSGTYCNGETQSTYVFKAMNCAKCEVYKQIRDEEGANLKL